MGKCTRPNFDSPRATLLRPQVARRLVLSQAVSLFLAISLHTRLDYALAAPLACTPLTLTTLCFSISISHAGFFFTYSGCYLIRLNISRPLFCQIAQKPKLAKAADS